MKQWINSVIGLNSGRYLKLSSYGKWQLNRTVILPYQTVILPYQTRTIIILSINQHVNE